MYIGKEVMVVSREVVYTRDPISSQRRRTRCKTVNVYIVKRFGNTTRHDEKMTRGHHQYQTKTKAFHSTSQRIEYRNPAQQEKKIINIRTTQQTRFLLVWTQSLAIKPNDLYRHVKSIARFSRICAYNNNVEPD